MINNFGDIFKCSTCGQDYYRGSTICPQCDKGWEGEILETRFIEEVEKAEKEQRTPIFRVDIKLLDEAINTCKKIEPELKVRGIYPVIRTIECNPTELPMLMEFMTQVLLLAERFAAVINKEKAEVLKKVFLDAEVLINSMSLPELSQYIDEIRTLYGGVKTERQRQSKSDSN